MPFRRNKCVPITLVFIASALLPACDDNSVDPVELSEFTLSFVATFEGQEVGCGDRMEGLGTSGTAEAEVSDLRFYVSELAFFDADGNPVPLELDENDFQYHSAEGDAALIDLTDTSAGACAGDGLSYPEGTARTNFVITGRTLPEQVRTVSFEVGVPQAVQKSVIASHTAEDAPTPLREMHWSWGYAYRNFVLNFTILDGGVAGEGYIHVGSTDCGGNGTQALTDRQTCGRPNAADVLLGSFDLGTSKVAVDLGVLFESLDFLVDQGGTVVPGVACHSGASQPDCPAVFGNLGIQISDGGASAALNRVFVKQ